MQFLSTISQLIPMKWGRWYKELTEARYPGGNLDETRMLAFILTPNVCCLNHSHERILTLMVTWRPHANFSLIDRARACDLHVVIIVTFLCVSMCALAGQLNLVPFGCSA